MAGPGSERVGIVGGGIVGLAVARRLLSVRPGSRVTVLEKDADVARHQTGRNSGVVHAGLYYTPGSLKATLCRRGGGLLKDFCAHHALPYEECGKLVVALDDEQAVRLRAIFARASANGVPGIRLLERSAIRDIEPHAEGLLAIHSPRTAIVDFAAVARAIASEIRAGGADVRCSFRVTAIHEGTDVVVASPADQLHFDRLVICAGLHGDRVARLAGHDDDPRVVPFRGEYYRLVPGRAGLVRGLIYPVPDPRLPFLGVHFTKRVGGAVDVGPNAVLALAREGYRWRDVSPRDVADMLRWPGFWRVARKYWSTAVSEVAGSLSKEWFVRQARAYVPELTARDVVPAPAGVRAQAVDRQGRLVDDFALTRRGSILAVRNAPSPAATSSLAIAEHICTELFGPG
jgi:L-2-hydroxyglutarate oxidase LhgO